MDLEWVKEESDRRMEAVKQMSERMWQGFEQRHAEKNIKVKSDE